MRTPGQTLKGKVAIVTGSSRGIGRAIATHLARQGARIVLCARDQFCLDEVVHEIEGFGGSSIPVALDLRMPESAGQLVDRAIAAFGRIDILINNAGATKRGEFLDLTDEDWADVHQTNRRTGRYCSPFRLRRQSCWQSPARCAD
jgi:NAD(P)-dependent dehydrogenase (short-subunit alcohol dehydrogenase family)